jgi:DNA-binding response OmpR family regulator
MRTVRSATALGGASRPAPAQAGAGHAPAYRSATLAPLAGLLGSPPAPHAGAGRAILVAARPETFAEEARCLAQHGFALSQAARLVDVARPGSSLRAEIVIIDGNALGADPAHWLAQLRQRLDCPLMVVANAGDEVDEIVALELGADDYLVRPFSPRKLLARLRALLRRRESPMHATAPADEHADRIEFGPLQLDRQALHASCHGRVLHLTPSQFEAVFLLAARAPRFVSREDMAAHLQRDAGAVSLRSVDVLMSRLRKQLQAHGATELAVVSVHGRGYRLELALAGVPALL